ncbi:N-acetylmuramoyl-L-alanine amidase [Nocardia sp. NBC_00511]|uniref:N-acetylmuramoyl-L-alanine amidase n=1 Tax=Nocardia sp. NBC_00511 TaxID=2903591 RepID=UPI0030E01819
MKPSITKAGIYTAVTAAAITTVAGLFPVAALAAPAAPDLPQKLTGKTVFLDPGHQGPGHTQDVNKQVSDGRGGTKACQTTGMTSLHGIAEHTINFNVAELVRTSLETLGAHVVMSRPDDTGWGGCVDDRAAAANQSGADVAVSIHADSGPADGRGFHLIIPQLPVADAKANEVQSGAGLTANKAMRDAYVQSGYSPATYNGAVDGLQTRADIAGPALTEVPDIFLEMGNGANVDDAQQLETPEGQLKHAVTITTGIASYLLGVPVPTDNAAKSEPATAPAPQAVPAQPALAPQAAPQASVLPAHARNVPQAQSTPQAPQPAAPQQAPAPTPQAPTPAQPASPGQLPDPQTPAESPQPDAIGGLQAFEELAQQFLNFGQQQGNPNPKSQTAPQSQPQTTTPAAPQAAPQPGAKPATPGTAPAVRPVAGGLNSVNIPPKRTPSTPGAQPTAPSSPGAQSNPGAQTPSTDKGTKADGLDVDSLGSLAQTAIKLLGPLAKMFLGTNGVGSDLINLAYTMASVLTSSLLATPAK